MRVLMTIRDDAQATLGGDTIQMLKTKAALEELGVAVEIRLVGDLDNAPTCDVAHVFNIQTVEESWAAIRKLETRKIPVVLSPIYWDMLEHWFDLAVEMRNRWRSIVHLMGRSAARRTYLAWQQAKSPASRTWRLQRRMLQCAVRVLPNSPSEATLLRRTFLLGKEFERRVAVVPNGIDVGMFDPAPTPSRWFKQRYGTADFVLEVGRISPVKNQLGLIEALYDLPTTIVIIGQSAPYALDYAERCHARGAQRGNVIFIDRLPHEELPGIYAAAAVHVLPSWRETPGLASLEAAASGCHVVTTSIGSTRDYFGDLAHYCRPDNRDSICAAVERTLAQPRTPQLREYVLRNFNWRRAGEATLQAYKAALDEA